MAVIYETLFFTITSLIIWFYWKNRHLLAAARKFPTGRLALPIIGHTYLIFNGFVGVTNILLKMIQNAVAQSITTLVLWAGPYPVFIISDPGDIQILLNSVKAFERELEPAFTKYIFGNSLFQLPGHLWKIRRRHMNPLFQHRNVACIVPQINECGRDLTHSLSQYADQREIDISTLINVVVLKSAHVLTFGPDIKVDVQSEEFQSVMQALDGISELITTRLFKFWLWPDCIFHPLYKKELNGINSSGKNFVKKSIKLGEYHRKMQRTEVMQRSDEKGTNMTTNVAGLRENKPGNASSLTMIDIYSTLQNVTPGYNEEDLCNEIIAVITAGSETVKITLLSCLQALGVNQDIQERLHAEILSVVGPVDKDLTIEDVKSMPYLKQVIEETLRKFIVAPFVTRRVEETIQLNTCTLPAGAIAVVALFGPHYNPKHYPDPLKFDPDRFNRDSTAQRSHGSFVPMSAGSRSCIAKYYGMTVIKVLLVHVIRKYKISTTADIDNITYMAGEITRRIDGYKLSLELRK